MLKAPRMRDVVVGIAGPEIMGLASLVAPAREEDEEDRRKRRRRKLRWEARRAHAN